MYVDEREVGSQEGDQSEVRASVSVCKWIEVIMGSRLVCFLRREDEREWIFATWSVKLMLAVCVCV